MSEALSLKVVGARLIALEKQVATLMRQMSDPRPRMSPSNGHEFAYVLLVDNREVWRGLDLEAHLVEVTKANPGRMITVSWEYAPDVLVV